MPAESRLYPLLETPTLVHRHRGCPESPSAGCAGIPAQPEGWWSGWIGRRGSLYLARLRAPELLTRLNGKLLSSITPQSNSLRKNRRTARRASERAVHQHPSARKSPNECRPGLQKRFHPILPPRREGLSHRKKEVPATFEAFARPSSHLLWKLPGTRGGGGQVAACQNDLHPVARVSGPTFDSHSKRRIDGRLPAIRP